MVRIEFHGRMLFSCGLRGEADALTRIEDFLLALKPGRILQPSSENIYGPLLFVQEEGTVYRLLFMAQCTYIKRKGYWARPSSEKEYCIKTKRKRRHAKKEEEKSKKKNPHEPRKDS